MEGVKTKIKQQSAESGPRQKGRWQRLQSSSLRLGAKQFPHLYCRRRKNNAHFVIDTVNAVLTHKHEETMKSVKAVDTQRAIELVTAIWVTAGNSPQGVR